MKEELVSLFIFHVDLVSLTRVIHQSFIRSSLVSLLMVTIYSFCMTEVLTALLVLMSSDADCSLCVCVLTRPSADQEDEFRQRSVCDRQPGAEPRESRLTVAA